MSETKNKTNKTETNQTTEITANADIKQFIKLADLTKEDMAKLPRASVIISKREFRKSNSIAYQIEVKLHEYLTIKKTITASRYNLLKLRLKLDFKQAEDTLRVPVRFVTGLTKNDYTYYQLEIILKDGLFETIFINDFDDIELFKDLLVGTVKIEERPEKIEDQVLSLGQE